MSLDFRLGTLLTCAHEAFDGHWKGPSFSVAPDSRGRFSPRTWQFRWLEGSLRVAAAVPSTAGLGQLCLWADGVDDAFWLATAIPEPAGHGLAQRPSTLVASGAGEGALSLAAVPTVPLRIYPAEPGAGPVRVLPHGGAPLDVPRGEDGHIDLSAFGAGLYDIGELGLVYASDMALRNRPALVVVLTEKQIGEALTESATVKLQLSARALYFRYFIFSQVWTDADAWTVRCDSPPANFAHVTAGGSQEAFQVEADAGFPWLRFPQDRRALGFVSTAPITYRSNASLFLELGSHSQPVRLPVPSLKPNTLARTSTGAQSSLCSDTFIHL